MKKIRFAIDGKTLLLQVKKKGKGPFYLASVVPSVLQTRDCYQWKPTVRPLPPLPLSVLRFTGIQSSADQRKVEADVEVTEDRGPLAQKAAH